jgi:hypothetical protein
VSARHQVKRPDRSFEEFALRKSHPAEETGFLRSVRIPWSAVSPGRKPIVKSGPDVFADALVPGTILFPETPPVPWLKPFPGCDRDIIFRLTFPLPWGSPIPQQAMGRNLRSPGRIYSIIPGHKGRGNSRIFCCGLDARVMQSALL